MLLRVLLYKECWINDSFSLLTFCCLIYIFQAQKSLFSLIGHMGQYVLVSPSQHVTLVRLGHSDSEERPPMLQQAADILELYPQR